MEKPTKKTITVSIYQRAIVRPLDRPALLWCQECRRNSPMMIPEQAAILFRTRTRDVYREIENGTLHFTELAGGELFVCCGNEQI